jgi:ribonuclease E
LNYLRRLWKTVVERVRKQNAPAELYQESDLVIRTIRDVFSTDFSEVIVDDRETAEKARQFLQVAMPRSRTSVTEYEGRQPLFHRYGIEQEIDRINGRQIPLPSGGSIVIDSTEAMVAIDVNSGKFRSIEDAEQTAYQTNLEAGEEIARQLRLRDLGGLIVCDFIDMRMDKHKRSVERALRDALKRHKERVRVLRMSQFGLIEITRQRQRPSITRSIYTDCAHCGGRGLIKRPESIMLEVMRVIQSILHREDVQLVRVKMAMEVAFDVLNRKRSQLNRLEQESGKRILMAGDPHFTADQVQYECEDARGRPVESGF